MSPTISVVLGHVDRLDINDLVTLERAIQARRRLLAARKPAAGGAGPGKTESPEQVRQARMFEAMWDAE